MTHPLTTDAIDVIQLARTGGPEVLELVRRALPQPAPHEVRVRAEAIGVGKPDALIRKGSYAWMPPLPAVPGNEMAGYIDALGSAVSHVRVGQRVLVSARELPQRGGCYAEAICVPAEALYLLPDEVSSVDAVTLGNYQLAGALLYASGIQRPTSVLIHGAAGGVGTAVLQLAEADGLLAIGTVSSDEKFAYAQAAGVPHLIHRGHQSVQTEVMTLTAGRGVDLVLDHVVGPGFSTQLDMLAPLGTLLSYSALAGLPSDNLLGDMRRLLSKSLGVRCYSIHTLDQAPAQRRALMERAISLMASGVLRPPPPMLFALRDARQAHTLLDAGQTLGKMVLLPQR